jgi:trimeric autotransporter adhesin
MRLFSLTMYALFGWSAYPQTYTIQTVAGGGLPTGIAGTAASIGGVYGVAVDANGNAFFTSAAYQGVLRLDARTGILTLIAGKGIPGFSGDNGPAVNARLNKPYGIALNSAGDVYIADYSNNRIRKISNGLITTVAGNGTPGFSGDNGPATTAQLNGPVGVAVDGSGNLYVSDTLNARVRKISNGVITTVAGGGSNFYDVGGQNGPATSALLSSLSGIAVDLAGNIYLAAQTAPSCL